MSQVSLKFVLSSPIQNIQVRAEKVIEKTLNTKLKKAAKIIETKLPPLLLKAIKSSHVYYSLIHNVSFTGGSFFGQIGVPDIRNKIDAIIHHWAFNHEPIDIKPFRFISGRISGGLRFRAIKADYSDVLSMEEARIIVDSDNGNVILPWLEWLLVGGNGYIIRDYTYFEDPSITQYSRTGTGIMRSDPGSGWKVPDEFAGTQENNWLTRILDITLESVSEEIFKILTK